MRSRGGKGQWGDDPQHSASHPSLPEPDFSFQAGSQPRRLTDSLSFPPLRVRDTRLSAPQEQGAWPKPRLSEVLKKCVRGKKYPLLSEMVHSCLDCSRRAGAA